MSACCLVGGLFFQSMVSLVSVLYLFFCGLVYVVKSSLHWPKPGVLYTGLALLGAFVYFTLPLVGALITPRWSAPDGSLIGQLGLPIALENTFWNTPSGSPMKPTSVRKSLGWMSTETSRSSVGSKIQARTGGLDFGSAVFIYEAEDSAPRWCGSVVASQSLLQAWIRPMNLDLDLAREIWMRDAVSMLPVPMTSGFLDFSMNEAREFDPRLQIAFVVLPIRAVPLLVWLRFRRKPAPSIPIAIATILAYLVLS